MSFLCSIRVILNTCAFLSLFTVVIHAVPQPQTTVVWPPKVAQVGGVPDLVSDISHLISAIPPVSSQA